MWFDRIVFVLLSKDCLHFAPAFYSTTFPTTFSTTRQESTPEKSGHLIFNSTRDRLVLISNGYTLIGTS